MDDVDVGLTRPLQKRSSLCRSDMIGLDSTDLSSPGPIVGKLIHEAMEKRAVAARRIEDS